MGDFVNGLKELIANQEWNFNYGSDVYAYMEEVFEIGAITLFLLRQDVSNARVHGQIDTQTINAEIILTMPGDYLKTYKEKYDSVLLALYGEWETLTRILVSVNCSNFDYLLESERIVEVADWGPQGLDGLLITAVFNKI